MVESVHPILLPADKLCSQYGSINSRGSSRSQHQQEGLWPFSNSSGTLPLDRLWLAQPPTHTTEAASSHLTDCIKKHQTLRAWYHSRHHSTCLQGHQEYHKFKANLPEK